MVALPGPPGDKGEPGPPGFGLPGKQVSSQVVAGGAQSEEGPLRGSLGSLDSGEELGVGGRVNQRQLA